MKAPDIKRYALIAGGVLLAVVISYLLLASEKSSEPAPASRTPRPSSPPTPALRGTRVDSEPLLEKVRSHYANVTDYSADFIQGYRYKGVRRVVEGGGRVEVKRPNLMRWEYDKPFPQTFVADGLSLYAYAPEERRVQVRRSFSGNDLTASLAFVWESGVDPAAFRAVRASKSPEGETTLELEPSPKRHDLARLALTIDETTGAVQRISAVDHSGNESRVTFTNEKLNQKLPDSRFQFEMPKDAKVEEK